MSVLEAVLYENLFKPGASVRISGDPAAKGQAEAAFAAFFTDATVSQLVDLLACSYCSLSPAQLARWEEAPEAFANECDAMSDLVRRAVWCVCRKLCVVCMENCVLCVWKAVWCVCKENCMKRNY
jgi:hypothetical protein